MTHFLLDASALAKRYVAELGSPLVNHLFALVGSTRLYCLTMGGVETYAVILRHRNRGLLTQRRADAALAALGSEVLYGGHLNAMEALDPLVLAAIPLIQRHNINTADAIVLRAALDLNQELQAKGDSLILVAADERLLRAAAAEGVATFDPEKQDLPALEALAAA
jgi:predicted nucleic acid-binding protein